VDDPVKYKDFAVMTDRWRLVYMGRWREPRNELFDRQTDHEQRKDVVDQHPDVVKALRNAYEDWWTDISPQFGETCEIVIGAEEENPTTLTAHSWHGEEGIYSQRHVRPAVRDNGYWSVEVIADGDYEFELRRWPIEADTPICAGLPPRTGVPFVDDFLVGIPVAVNTAKIQVGDEVKEKSVGSGDKGVSFRLSLKTGSTRVRTWFDDGSREPLGAYYVYVRRM
jgi:hypothetical protein